MCHLLNLDVSFDYAHFMYYAVYGHQTMHFRHKVQSFLTMISSRVVVTLHVLPSKALVGTFVPFFF